MLIRPCYGCIQALSQNSDGIDLRKADGFRDRRPPPHPYGRELKSYEVANLAQTLGKAKAAGVTVLAAPYTANDRSAPIMKFPGGYIAEIHYVVSEEKQSAIRSLR